MHTFSTRVPLLYLLHKVYHPLAEITLCPPYLTQCIIIIIIISQVNVRFCNKQMLCIAGMSEQHNSLNMYCHGINIFLLHLFISLIQPKLLKQKEKRG